MLHQCLATRPQSCSISRKDLLRGSTSSDGNSEFPLVSADLTGSRKATAALGKTTPTEKMGRLCCCWSCLHASVVCCGRVHAGCSRQRELQATSPFPESERSLAPSETARWACSWKLSWELRYVRETFKHRSEFHLCPLFGPKIKQKEKIRTNCLT